MYHVLTNDMQGCLHIHMVNIFKGRD